VLALELSQSSPPRNQRRSQYSEPTVVRFFATYSPPLDFPQSTLCPFLHFLSFMPFRLTPRGLDTLAVLIGCVAVATIPKVGA